MGVSAFSAALSAYLRVCLECGRVGDAFAAAARHQAGRCECGGRLLAGCEGEHHVKFPNRAVCACGVTS